MRAVIEMSAVHAVERKAMDHAGVAVGDEQLARSPIESQSAERRPGIRHAGERDIGEQRDRAGDAIDFPDRSRPAVGGDGTEQAGHEGGVRCAAPRTIGTPVAVGIGNDDRQSIGRGGGGVDVRRAGVVERKREHLSDLSGRRRERLWRGNELGLRRPAHAAEIDHPQRGTVEVDVGLVETPCFRRRTQHVSAGKSGNGRVTGREYNGRTLRKRRRRLQQKT